MKNISHLVWFARWLQRLSSSLLRRRKIIDIFPSCLSPQHRLIFDRRVKGFQLFKLRKELADYWAYDHCVALTSFDLEKFPQWSNLQIRYQAMLSRSQRPLILDCGANIGFSAYWLATEFPEALVLAVEPDSENIKLAKYNTRHCKNIQLIQAAVASKDCKISLMNLEMGSDAFRTEVNTSGTILGYSISSLINLAHQDINSLFLVKMDIEGFESEVFSSDTDWVDLLPALVVETHDWMLHGQANSRTLLQAISRTPRDFVTHGEHIISFHL